MRQILRVFELARAAIDIHAVINICADLLRITRLIHQRGRQLHHLQRVNGHGLPLKAAAQICRIVQADLQIQMCAVAVCTPAAGTADRADLRRRGDLLTLSYIHILQMRVLRVDHDIIEPVLHNDVIAPVGTIVRICSDHRSRCNSTDRRSAIGRDVNRTVRFIIPDCQLFIKAG